DADHRHEQADRHPNRALQAFRDHAAERQADCRAGDHGPGVEHRAETWNHGRGYRATLELFEAVDVHDEDGRASHLDLDRIGNEEVAGLDQRRHRIHELTAGPAILFDQTEDLLDAVVVDPGHQRHVLVLKKTAGAGEAGDGDAAIIERIHRR